MAARNDVEVTVQVPVVQLQNQISIVSTVMPTASRRPRVRRANVGSGTHLVEPERVRLPPVRVHVCNLIPMPDCAHVPDVRERHEVRDHGCDKETVVCGREVAQVARAEVVVHSHPGDERIGVWVGCGGC